MPMITVVIPSYNKSNYIVQTVESVLQQSLRDWEVIIVDDCSQDDTRDKLKIYLEDPRICFFWLEHNHGANYCRNLGLKNSRSNYVLFLDADDLLDKNCLGNRLEAVKKNPGLDFCVFPMRIFRRQIGDSNYTWWPSKKNPLDNFLKHDLPWQTMQPIWRRDFLLEVGGFDEKFRRFQDVELHTRVLLNKGVRYELRKGIPDCYYRIYSLGQRTDSFEFLNNWIESAVNYCNKFVNDIPEDKKKLLLGTIYAGHLQLISYFKEHLLVAEDFNRLVDKLYNADLVRNSSNKKKILRVSKFYNLSLPRVPGINKLLKSILIG